MVRAVLFDFYGTLARAVEWGPSHHDVFARWGFELDPEAYARWQESAPDGLEHLDHSRSRDHYVAWERDRLSQLAQACGVGPDEVAPLVADLHSAAKQFTMRAYDEVPAVLAELRGRGVLVAVCSNWDWDLDRALTQAGLDGLLDVVVTSARAGARKPHPRIFRHTLDRCGVTIPDALFVGDSWHPDVEGPLAMGLPAVHVHRPEEADLRPVPPDELPPGVTRVADLRPVPALAGVQG